MPTLDRVKEPEREIGAGVTIGRVTEETGLSVHALRFYERQGLLTGPVERSASGHRVYRPQEIEWIKNCRRFRAAGMPIATIRRFAELVRQGPGTAAERLDVLREHEQMMRRRMDELRDSLALIQHKVESYEAELAQGDAAELWR